MSRNVVILVLGVGNADYHSRIRDIEKSIRDSSLGDYSDLQIESVVCESLTTGPALLSELADIDLVYIRESDGRELASLTRDIVQIAAEMEKKSNKPWVILGKDDGSVNYDASLMRLAPLFRERGVKVAQTYLFGIIVDRLEFQQTLRGPPLESAA